MDTAVAKLRRKYKPGLIEALVSLCILVTLAGIVVPIMADRADGPRYERTETALSDIARGVQAYTRDTGLTPTSAAIGAGQTNVTWLYGPGEMPRNHPFGADLQSRPLANVLGSLHKAPARFHLWHVQKPWFFSPNERAKSRQLRL